MATLEERLARVETRLEEQVRVTDGIREAIVHLEERMDRRFEAVDRRFETIDHRFEAIDQRFDAIDRRFEMIDRRFESIDRRFEGVDQRFVGLDQRLDTIDRKISSQFLWMVGIQVGTLAAVLTAFVTMLAR